jgi:hypothetical protein
LDESVALIVVGANGCDRRTVSVNQRLNVLGDFLPRHPCALKRIQSEAMNFVVFGANKPNELAGSVNCSEVPSFWEPLNAQQLSSSLCVQLGNDLSGNAV